MNKLVAKRILTVIIVAAGSVSYGQSGAGYAQPNGQTYAAPQNQYPCEPEDVNPRSSYDPLAGRHIGQHTTGRGLKQQLNPTGQDYGIVMNGWHDAIFLLTLKSVEFWFGIVSCIAFLALLAEYIHRRIRMDSMRQAFAGAALLFLNERGFLLRKANDATWRHNELVEKIDKLARDGGAAARMEEAMAIRSAAAQAALPPVSAQDTNGDHEQISAVAAQETPTSIATTTQDTAQLPTPEVAATTGEETDSAEPSGDGNVNWVTIKIGRSKYKAQREVQLYINSLSQKLENRNQRINQLEERLAQYENK